MVRRRTSIKSRRSGEPYYTYRLVESVRSEHGVRQRTLLNLGRHFEVPREQWTALAQRIEQIIDCCVAELLSTHRERRVRERGGSETGVTEHLDTRSDVRMCWQVPHVEGETVEIPSFERDALAVCHLIQRRRANRCK